MAGDIAENMIVLLVKTPTRATKCMAGDIAENMIVLLVKTPTRVGGKIYGKRHWEEKKYCLQRNPA